MFSRLFNISPSSNNSMFRSAPLSSSSDQDTSDSSTSVSNVSSSDTRVSDSDNKHYRRAWHLHHKEDLHVN